MTDLVERLREHERFLKKMDYPAMAKDVCEAATEIERLRADAEKVELVRMTLAGFFRKELTMYGCVMVIESFVNPQNVTPEDIEWAQQEIVRIDAARASVKGST